MKKNILRILVLVLLAGGIAAAVFNRGQIDLESVRNLIKNSGPVAPLVFMLLYIAGTPLFLPGSVLAMAGGAVFGPFYGTFYNLTAATIGSMLAFLIARFTASEWIEKKTGGRMKQLVTGVEKEGWKFVAFVRLVPLFPFNLLNYALGLTRISFFQYSITTYITMLPGAIAYTYLGYIGREAATGGEDLIKKGMLALALLAAAAFLPRFIINLRRGGMIEVEELKNRLNSGEDILLLDVRTEKDFNGEQGHISASRLIPLEELVQRIEELSGYMEKPVLTICRTDKKSGKAAKILAGKGFADVHVVKGGMTAWNDLK